MHIGHGTNLIGIREGAKKVIELVKVKHNLLNDENIRDEFQVAVNKDSNKDNNTINRHTKYDII